MKFRFAIVLALWCAALLSPAFSQTVTPEGGLRLPTLLAPECMAVPYAPLPVYDSPGGLRIGALVLDHPEYVQKTMPNCLSVPTVHLQSEGFQELTPVVLMEWSGAEVTLAGFSAVSHLNELWVQGRTKYTAFWVPVRRGAQYLSVERDLATAIGRVGETCNQQGECLLSTQDFKEQVAKAERLLSQDCQRFAYEIDSVVVLPSGRRAYKALLTESLRPQFGKKLPLELLVPTYDVAGKWTGASAAAVCPKSF